jgi:hypothetical protein
MEIFESITSTHLLLMNVSNVPVQTTSLWFPLRGSIAHSQFRGRRPWHHRRFQPPDGSSEMFKE